MRIAIGTFAYAGIAARFESEAAAGIDAALRHYTRRLKSASPPVPVPSFARGAAPDGGSREFDLALGPEVERTLVTEARTQGISTDMLAGHAVFVYLADMDASVGDSSSGFVEEDPTLPRYLRRCVSLLR